MSRLKKTIIPILLLACFVLFGCSPQQLHKARDVVAQADSLWATGQLYTDSMQLAEAYQNLDKWLVLYPDDYAHECYHYGRLLRSQDNPVAAMQVFINATHSRTRDYHILGRVYSNMGSICHLAGEYDLSYDMYERSAKMFLQDGDSLLYYYGVNNMAFEMAEKGDKENAILLLSKIIKLCSNNAVLTKTVETRAAACFYAQQYDSAIYYAQELYQLGNTEPTGLLLRARAYSYSGINDSAVFYAKQVLQISQDLFHLNNALYILTEDDKNKDIASVRQTAADRSDVQKLLEIRQGNLSQAVQLLEQDLNRKPDWRWAYASLGTLAVIGTCICLYVYQRRKRHALLTQKIGDLEQTASTIQHKHEKLTELYTENYRRIEDEILGKCELLRNSNNIADELEWHNFDKMCHVADSQFYMLASKLRQKNVLNETEIRLCVLVLIDFSRSKIADILPYAVNGVGKFKFRVAQKLGTEGKNLQKYLISLAINGHSDSQ